MIETTKGSGFASQGTGAVLLRTCAAGVLAVSLAGRAPMPIETPPGVLVPGSHQVLVGHIDACGSPARDEITFVAAAPCHVRFRLTATLPGTDLELCSRDHARVERIGATGIDVAQAGERVDLEVRSAWGASYYGLEIEAVPLVAGSRAAAGSWALR